MTVKELISVLEKAHNPDGAVYMEISLASDIPEAYPWDSVCFSVIDTQDCGEYVCLIPEYVED